MLHTDGEKQGTEVTIVYELNGIRYVPHYRDVGVYVGPGYEWHTGKQSFNATQLLAAGAVETIDFLWPRRYLRPVTDPKKWSKAKK